MLSFLILRPAWALCLCLLAAIGVQSFRLHSAQAAIAQEQVLRAQATQAALAASTQYREREAAMQAKLEDATHVLQAQTDFNAHALAAVRTDRNRLRKQLSDYAAGSSTTPDTVAACGDRASTLGDLLANVLQGYASVTAEAEDRAAEVRALLDAWPKP